MRVYVDPETGEMVEALPEDVAGTEPYDYANFRRAVFGNTREHREALRKLEAATKASAKADADYHRELAKAVLEARDDVGATNAETVAKGTDAVVQARERRLAAEGLERAAMEKVRLCRDDRISLHIMGGWSREADADGWAQAGGA